jgi:separase
LRKCAVSRMPSLSFLAAPQQQPFAVDASNAFYILNPSNDLAATQAAFLQSFRQRGWRGIAGVAPTSEQFLEALKAHDLFIYCGHNSGEQYLRRESIERKLEAVRPVSLLMGCSSAALRDLGRYDPCGIVQSYLAAKCPAVAGNLFDVTDADIDRFLAAVLDKWLAAGATPEASLAQCVADARDTCKLPYLVGSSPVVYGLPTITVSSVAQ